MMYNNLTFAFVSSKIMYSAMITYHLRLIIYIFKRVRTPRRFDNDSNSNCKKGNISPSPFQGTTRDENRLNVGLKRILGSGYSHIAKHKKEEAAQRNFCVSTFEFEAAADQMNSLIPGSCHSCQIVQAREDEVCSLLQCVNIYASLHFSSWTSKGARASF